MLDENGWSKYSKLVIKELEDHSNRLDSIDSKLGNHVTHIEHRLTQIETNYKNIKYILYLIFTIMLGIFGTVLANYVGHI